MSLTDDEIGRIYRQLAELLKKRDYLELAVANGRPREALSKRRLRLLEDAFALVADILGPNGFREYPESLATVEIQKFVGQILLGFPLAIPKNNGWRHVFQEIGREIWMLQHGDVPTLLSPSIQRPGRHPKYRELCVLRSSAVLWDLHLKAKGISLWERRRNIEHAFRTPWDTIRKWRSLIAKMHGEHRANELIHTAEAGKWRIYEGDYLQYLTNEGEVYWEVLNNKPPKFGKSDA